jgi:hypothetical protein
MSFHRGLAGSLLIILFSQTILLGGGLLGACAEDASKICRCNHGSKKEKHSHKDDNLFQVSKGKKGLALSDSPTTKNRTALNCHTVTSNEEHICSCKKSKSSLARLSIYYQTWISASSVSSLIVMIADEFTISNCLDKKLDEWDWNLIKPPRLT